jgi:hypothetical protein
MYKMPQGWNWIVLSRLRAAGVAEEGALAFHVSVSNLREHLDVALVSEKQVLAIEV